MSNIFHPEDEQRYVSLKEIVEAVEGTSHKISDGVRMDDYGYPVYEVWLDNDKYTETIVLQIPFDAYNSYEEPMYYHEIHFFTDDGFAWAQEIINSLNIQYHFVNFSSHSDMCNVPDEEWDIRANRYNEIVKEYNLKEQKHN